MLITYKKYYLYNRNIVSNIISKVLIVMLSVFSLPTISSETQSYEEIQVKIRKCGEIAEVASKFIAAATVDDIPKKEILDKLNNSTKVEREALTFLKLMLDHAYKASESGSVGGFVEFYYDTCLNNFDEFKDM